MPKKWFVVVLSVVVMSWSAAALADPITYSVIEYSASASAAWMDDSPSSSATPPVSAAAIISENLQASGLADLDKVEGYAKNFESTFEYVHGGARSSYEFTNCSRIGVSFEYAAYAYAETAIRYVAGFLAFDLLDTTTNESVLVFRIHPILRSSSGLLYEHGWFDETFSLAKNHEYLIYFEATGSISNGYAAEGYGWFQNIDVQCVPTPAPPTLLLLASGLLGLVSLKKRRS